MTTGGKFWDTIVPSPSVCKRKREGETWNNSTCSRKRTDQLMIGLGKFHLLQHVLERGLTTG
jgi:hypothetical protein